MKLAELLPLITEQTMIELSYLSGSDTRVACRCCDTHSVIDYIREEGQNIAELIVVSVDPDVYYFDDYDWYAYDPPKPELLITVDGWEETVAHW
jgi:hypothetical protein